MRVEWLSLEVGGYFIPLRLLRAERVPVGRSPCDLPACVESTGAMRKEYPRWFWEYRARLGGEDES